MPRIMRVAPALALALVACSTERAPAADAAVPAGMDLATVDGAEIPDAAVDLAIGFDLQADDGFVADAASADGVLDPACGRLPTDVNTYGLWHLDEGSGHYMNSSSGNGHHGYLGNGSFPYTNQPTWVSGRFGTALHFDNAACGTPGYACQYAQVDDLFGSIGSATNQVTIELWVRLSPPFHKELFVGIDAVDENSFSFTPSATAATWEVAPENAAALQKSIATTLGDGAWHYVAQAYDGSTMTLYVDGTERASGSVNIDKLDDLKTTFFGGRRFTSVNFFNGDMDEIRISSVARSSTEISSYYAAAALCP
jgi:hypothetical protein